MTYLTTIHMVSLVVMVIVLIIMIVNRTSNKHEKVKDWMFAKEDDLESEKKWKKSKQAFLDWKQQTTPQEWQKMLKTALIYFNKDMYLKDEDIQDYDIQDRMDVLRRDLDEEQITDIYPNPNDLASYISGGHFSHKRAEMYDYFRNTFINCELYDYEKFLSIMADPATASWRRALGALLEKEQL